ncbi:N-acetylmuramoyl-L-alanine amidase [Bacteroides sp. KH569_7]|uniref:N-acetylmuramoyl-L-alanine amidase n=1 Tax=Bacteroides muris (ex Fokt et al. 2023) TaxID=2937417 RepID=A0A9X2P0R6_9BACE|nr:N-acetylmuramoyl-L-alanine amidase [Bacteroides muris (ex Fokt et al. 2023)]MCR6509886.1 N-acetylmuramoyl-L-alanine amidase [Bacteroides muris (ex Fokt et al. 2023)]
MNVIASRPINLIVIHCTASRCDRVLSPSDLDSLHRRRGFDGCGYHYYITRDGHTHAMRPLHRIGAHARGHNARSIGIAYEGGLLSDGTPADTRTRAQRSALRSLISRLLVLYPRSTVCGHRDLSPDLNGNGIIEPQEWLKQCPCFDASAEYATLRP